MSMLEHEHTSTRAHEHTSTTSLLPPPSSLPLALRGLLLDADTLGTATRRPAFNGYLNACLLAKGLQGLPGLP